MSRASLSLLSAALLCAFAGAFAGACSRQDVDAPATSGAVLSGVMVDAQLAEISGLAASRRHKGVLWMHDDGGNPARLFAVDASGSRLATLRVEGVPKTDWEDLAAFRLDGHDYLLLADTGDNGGLRHTLQLHVLEEPATLENARLKPVWSITFRWPDGPRDCEAVAVDAAFGQVLLVSKKRQPPELFSLPLRPDNTQVQTARLVTTLSGIPQPGAAELRRDPQARELRRITAADLSPDGRTLAVMTYRDLLLYGRKPGEGWAQALLRAPKVQTLPLLPQAEALGWAADGKSLYATSEFVPAPLYRITP
ncbi:hypothetical protein [Lysobacter fragariae]